MTPGLIERYRDRLPVSAATPIVTLGEGGDAAAARAAGLRAGSGARCT